MPQWTVNRVLAGLKCFIHEENISELVDVRASGTFDENELLPLLEKVLEGAEEQLGIYGTVEEIYDDLKIVNMMPEFIKFSTNGVTELSEECMQTSGIIQIKDSDKNGFYSKQEIALLFHSTMMELLVEKKTIVFAMAFYSPWLLSFFHKIREDLKGCYEYVLESTWTSIKSEIESLKFNLEYRLKGEKAKQFFDLRFRQDLGDKPLFKRPLEILDEMIKENPIQQNQELYDHIYDCIDTIINDTKKVHQRYIEVFTPFSGSQIPSQYQTSVVRLFNIPGQQFFLAKELEKALELSVKRRYPKRSFPNGLMRSESEEDRKHGIVFSVSVNEFKQILEKLELTEKDLNICIFPLFRDYQLSFLPILSSYGTHCKPALHVFNDLIFYITVVLRLFERSRDENIQKVLSVIAQFEYLFTQKDNMYLIETWKIEEIFNQAKRELKTTFNKAGLRIVRKPFYTVPEVLDILQTLGKTVPLGLMFSFESFYQLTLVDPKKTFNIKEIYFCHSQAVKLFILSKNEKMLMFEKNQTILCFESCNHNLLSDNNSRLQQLMNDPDNKEDIRTMMQKFETRFGNDPGFAQVLNKLEKDSEKKTIEFELAIRENNKLKEQIANKDSQIKNFKSELKLRKNAKQQLEKLTEKNQQKIANIERSHEARVRNLIFSSTTKDKKIKDLQEELGKLTENNKEIMESQKSLKQENSILLAKNRSLMLENSIFIVHKQPQTSNTDMENEDNQIKDLEEKNKTLTEDIKRMRNENEQLKLREKSANNEKTDILRKFEELNKTHKKCEKSVIMDKRQIQSVKTASESKDKQIKCLEAKNKKWTMSIEQLKKENEMIRERENAKNDELFNLRQELEYHKQRGNERNKSLDENVNDRMMKYEKIIRTDYEALIDTIWANLHKLTRRYPNCTEFHSAQSKLKRFDENLENYLKIVKEDYWRMRDNPNIRIEELHSEVAVFPSQQFKEKYDQWVIEYNLDPE